MVAAANPKSKNRILVIDDESDITLTFELVLGGEGFEVDSFNDPMPTMDGLDLYRKLKNIDDNIKLAISTCSFACK